MKSNLKYLFIFFLASCTSTRIDTFQIKESPNPFHRVMVVFIANAESFDTLDEAIFNNSIGKYLNDLDSYPIRIEVKESFQEKLSSHRTAVLSADSFFEINQKVSFQEFKDVIDSTRTEALLFVNLKSFETSQIIIDGNSYDNSFSYFNTYLYDLRQEKTIWISRNELDGFLHKNTGKVIDKLAKTSYKSLRDAGYIYPKESYSR